MGIEQGFGANEEPEVVGEKQISQEKEYSQEELAKIGENVLKNIILRKKVIEKYRNGEYDKNVEKSMEAKGLDIANKQDYINTWIENAERKIEELELLVSGQYDC
ncbi:MAG: hypothetical protein WC998_00050 [Candidatus Paceibacterota bacterium]|jgi:hypothetical protein